MAQIFPKWTNEIPKIAPPVATVAVIFATFVIWFWWSPKHTDVGYAPVQPVPYSHKLHAGDLGIDCRYCHNNAENSPHAGVPPTATCLNCHSQVKADSPKLAALRKSDREGTPVSWKRIHKIPDYAYFDHSVHLNLAGKTAGIGCKSCHGRVDQMVVVRQDQPLSMGWCLACHREVRRGQDNGFPITETIRPADKVADMVWTPDASWASQATEIAKGLKPPTVECTGCHR
jgi:hypothetical protein